LAFGLSIPSLPPTLQQKGEPLPARLVFSD
jgi:hypothetical protein